MRRDSEVRLARLTYPEAEARLAAGAWALLPTGATEAHGPHLPLNTDVVISERGAIAAAELLATEGTVALVLPPIPYSVTEFASEFSGTVSIPEDAARLYVRSVIEGAVRTGFRGVVVCNAHLEPGNITALAEAVAESAVPARFVDVTKKPHALRLGDEFKSGACHAGSYETSLVLAADPFLVKDELAQSLDENPTSLSRAIRAGKKTFIEAGGPNAYFGNPAVASAAEGKLLYEEMADIFASGVRELIAERNQQKGQ